jgi:glycosyltransferase involved in cell wall biosynthesis
MRIDQWVPALHRGDAIGDSARLMRDAFRSWGHAADVYALDLDDELEGDGRRFAEWRPGGPADVVILHFAIPSPLGASFREHRGRRVLLHHNLTPGSFFAGWDDEMVRIAEAGREELASLAPSCDLGLGDSEWNRRELEALGARRTGVLPIYLDFGRYREAPSPVRLRMLADGRTNLVFVGRVAPNKRPDDLVRLASYWKRFVSPSVRLLLVGKLPRRATGRGEPLRRHYHDALVAFAYEEGLTPEEVVFTGHVEHDDLLACYRRADVFVSMSEHEGFGVPLVEAMLMDVPVLARSAAAVDDTLGGAGVAFRGGSIAEAAETARLLVEDRALRERVLLGQRRRLEAFTPATVEAALRGYLLSLQGA